jgi:hypothetical protein
LLKTTLYFNNPLWLQFLLQPKKDNKADVSDGYAAVRKKEEPVLIEEQALAEDKTAHLADVKVSQEEQPVLPQQEEELAEEKTEAVNIPDQAETISVMEIVEQYNYKDIAEQALLRDHNNAQATTIPTQEPATPLENAATEEQIDYFNQNTAPETEATNDIETTASTEMTEPANQEPIMVIKQEMETPVTFETDNVKVPVTNQPGDFAESSAQAESMESISTTQTLLDEGVNEADNTEMPKIDQEVENSEEKPLLKTIVETPASKDDILFEPYHTIDYFASQGIKLSKIEPEPQDKLGRQLKSFTEWLKMMKKLPQASVNKILAENEESQVVEAANHSIESKEVITEAMAEVYEKQGLHEKATEVYHKLSLLNPGKSAYFAARIEALKQ